MIRAVTIDPACTPCLVRQGADVSLLLPEGEARDTLVAEVEQIVAAADAATRPVAVSQAVHRRLRVLTGSPDPYRGVKRVFNGLAQKMLPELAGLVRQAPDPLRLAARLSIIANVIDFGPDGSLTPVDAIHALRGVQAESFHEDWASFRAALTGARSILFLADNAGEVVVDQLLIGLIGADRVTVVVRGGPVSNDVTMDDARELGLDRVVEVIDNGSDAPGTLLDDCDPAFRERFDAADMIISKGQGNFETLSNADRQMFFLFKVKCSVVARYVGLPVGTNALIDAKRWRAAAGAQLAG